MATKGAQSSGKDNKGDEAQTDVLAENAIVEQMAALAIAQHVVVKKLDILERANKTAYDEVLMSKFQEKQPIAQEVFKTIKEKLGGKPASTENVYHIIKQWYGELKREQAINAGIIETKAAPNVPEQQSQHQEAPPKAVPPKLLLAYLKHALMVPSAIAEAVRFYGLSEKSTEGQAKAVGELANQAWGKVEAVKNDRLAELYKGQRLEDVKAWLRDAPIALTYQQMKERDDLRQFKPEQPEDSKVREKALSVVHGYGPVLAQREKMAVARATEKRLGEKGVQRRMAEHQESERVLMQQRYGILPISTSRQDGVLNKAVAMAGFGRWQNDFEIDLEKYYVDYPADEYNPIPRRARLAEDQLKTPTYPERRKAAKNLLEEKVPKRYFAHGVLTKDPKLAQEFKKRLEEDKDRLGPQYEVLSKIESDQQLVALAEKVKQKLRL
ncbi:MAG: hypothetical protein AB7V32_03465 [Candidatus Berkiella sp.]